MLVAGILMLTLGATLLVESASTLARSMGVSELVIGLTIVAGGTSAPELVTCLIATMRGKTDLGIGNILGSCCERELRTRSREERKRPGGALVGRAITSQVRISIHMQNKVIQSVFLTYVTCQGLFNTRVHIAHEPVQRFVAERSPLGYPR